MERTLLIDGIAASIGARAFDVLLALVERRDRVVTKNELLDIVWRGVIVEENNLQAQVSALRKLLGPKALATIPGQGYRFAISLATDGPSAGAPVSGVLETTNLPASLGELIGREDDLAALSRLIDAHRLVTVLGAGGIGKTQLALAAARGLSTPPAHGVWWVDLAFADSTDKVATAIANAAGVRLGDGASIALLARALSTRKMLLVLDNCEHLAKDVALVASAALESSPALRILATSQEPLQVPGERLYRLDALALPAVGTSLETARRFGAIRLFEARAQGADGRFCLTDGNVAEALELCRHLDGIPLAIEMAAARVPLLGLQALNARLGERLSVLRSSTREAPARHQTLRSTLDWSYSLLTSDEQLLLRRLAVFLGSFRLEAAQTAAADETLDKWAALDVIGALVDKSLVQVQGGDPPRYRLLESTRLYAAEKGDERCETGAAHLRHAKAMYELSDELIRAWFESDDMSWISRYHGDYEDLHAAFDRAAARGDAHTAALISRALSVVDFERNVYSNVRRRKQAAYRLLPAADPLERAYLLDCLTLFRLIFVPQMTRLEVSQARVAAWRALGQRRQLYMALARIAGDLAIEGQMQASLDALAEARGLEDPAWNARYRWFLAFGGRNASLYGEDGKAHAFWSRSMLQLAVESRWQSRIAESRVSCAQAALFSGDIDEALRLCRESIEELRGIDQPITLVDALTVQCASHAAAGDLNSARAAALESLNLPWQLENAVSLFDQMGWLATRLARHVPAAQMLGFADRGYVAAQDRRHAVAARAERQASASIDAALGTEEHKRWRAAGAIISEEQARALAKEALREP